MKKDTFLKHYTVKEVQFGLIDQKKAIGAQPVPKTYNENAEILDDIGRQNTSKQQSLKYWTTLAKYELYTKLRWYCSWYAF